MAPIVKLTTCDPKECLICRGDEDIGSNKTVPADEREDKNPLLWHAAHDRCSICLEDIEPGETVLAHGGEGKKPYGMPCMKRV